MNGKEQDYMIQWRKDFILSSIIIAFSILGIIYAGEYKTKAVGYALAQPSGYIRLWLGLFLLSGSLLLIRTLKVRSTEKGEKIWDVKSVYTVAAFAVYILLMKLTGFLIATIAFLFSTLIVYSWDQIKKEENRKMIILKIAGRLLFAVMTAISIELLFTEVLGVSFP